MSAAMGAKLTISNTPTWADIAGIIFGWKPTGALAANRPFRVSQGDFS
jgi:hypothetical protein